MSADSSVGRSRLASKRYSLAPERIDDAILAAINANLCLAANGDGRDFGRETSSLACA